MEIVIIVSPVYSNQVLLDQTQAKNRRLEAELERIQNLSKERADSIIELERQLTIQDQHEAENSQDSSTVDVCEGDDQGTVTEEIISSSKTTTEYNSGSSVRLTAIPSGEWNTFENWTGDIDSQTSVIELLIDEPKNITVNFQESSLIINDNITEIVNSSISIILPNKS